MNQHYTSTAKLLHWLLALLIFGLLGLGFYMTSLRLSPTKLQLYSWHKWAGISVFVLSILRLLWRYRHRPPALPANMGQLEALAAHAGHALLYLLCLAIPISGWLMSSAKGVPTVWFGVLPLPDLVAKNETLGDLLLTLHQGLNLLLIVTILGHVAAALKHHFYNQDEVLRRMLPGRSQH